LIVLSTAGYSVHIIYSSFNNAMFCTHHLLFFQQQDILYTSFTLLSTAGYSVHIIYSSFNSAMFCAYPFPFLQQRDVLYTSFTLLSSGIGITIGIDTVMQTRFVPRRFGSLNTRPDETQAIKLTEKGLDM
jgi:hypothetical protein